MALSTRSIIWLDVNGATTQTIVNSDPDASSIQAALLSNSNADVLNWWESAPNPNGAPAPSASVFQTVQDKARLLFLDSGGSLVTFNLPAPQSGIFLADGVTVDATAIAVLIAAVIADGRSGAGNPIISYVAGNLIRTKAYA